ncbi:Serine/threonine-protein kinase mph1 [Hordeum vulgare]|nr:Serine/threonine-protein kinase mph1 [Hordeum vulgare]
MIAPSIPRPSAVIDLNVTSGSSSGVRPSVEMQRKQAQPPSTATMSSPPVLFDEMPTPTPMVEDPFYNEFMENVIYEGSRGEAFQMGGHGDAFDPQETQSQDGRVQYFSNEDFEVDDHGDSWHEDDDIYCEGEGHEEEEGINIVGEPLFIDELTQRAKHKRGRRAFAFQSLEAFKARHNDKPFTLTRCWRIINNFHKFKGQYRELQRKRGKNMVVLGGGGDGEALKRPRGKTNSKMDDKHDVASFPLHETLHGMMSQKQVRGEKKRQGKEEQMNQYLKLQTKKFDMEEAAKKTKINMEEASRQRELDIEATNAATKAKEVALAIMSVDLSKMSEKTRSWF